MISRLPPSEANGCGGFRRPERHPATARAAQDNARFVAILTPDESWWVFDNLAECPAETRCGSLIGLSREEAAAAARRLNQRLRRFGDREASDE